MPSPQALLVPAFNPGPMTGGGNNTYLIPGARAVLVDAGVGEPRHIAAIQEALAAVAGTICDVLITHGHRDHASGAPALRAVWPSARFWKFPWPAEDDRLGVAVAPLADGQRLDTASGPLDVVHTPGHSPDHCCFWMPRSRTLFGGDLVREGGTVVIPGSRGGNMAAYLGALERVTALEPRRVLPAHGGPIEQPLNLLRYYVAHRGERETQVLAAMRDGLDTIESIAARIYEPLPAALTNAARDTVLAHLAKLQAEGRAECIEGRWRRTPLTGPHSSS